jgi:TatD DNase family protein
MIDTHAHLTSRFGRKKGDIDGLEYVILAASSINDSKENITLAKSDKRLLPSVGIHPQEINKETDAQISSLEELLKKHKEIVAVGECGLELVGEVDKNLQIKFFEKQIELSLKYDKAIIVHSRKATEETLEVLKKYQNLRGVIHCYSGGKKKIKNFLELGENWFFGIDGNVTYESGLIEVVKNIPKDRLVLETDSPFLAPTPHRGEENKPAWIKNIYEKVVEIWGEEFKKTEKIIDDNAKRLFKII